MGNVTKLLAEIRRVSLKVKREPEIEVQILPSLVSPLGVRPRMGMGWASQDCLGLCPVCNSFIRGHGLATPQSPIRLPSLYHLSLDSPISQLATPATCHPPTLDLSHVKR